MQKIKKRGRPQVNYEQIPARLPAGTLERIEVMLSGRETRAALIRVAIERELARRERLRRTGPQEKRMVVIDAPTKLL